MPDKMISVLGVPISNLTKNQTVKYILKKIDQYPANQEPSFVTSIDAAFFVHSHNWSSTGVRSQELFHILRSSSLVTAKGKTISLLCRILNSPLKETVGSKDLLLPLAQTLGKRRKSVFIIGKDSLTTQKAVKELWDRCPGLEIVGTSCPDIPINGKHLVDADTIDALVLEQIHNVAPDILFVSIGTPQQEIWFERIKGKLRIPVTVALSDILSPKHRWNPFRWWNKKIIGSLKFLYMTTPLMVYHTISRIIYSLIYRKRNDLLTQNETLLFLSQDKSIAIIQLPPLLNKNNFSALKQKIGEAFAQDILILDFKAVRHLDLSGVALMLTTWERSRNEKKELYGLNMSGDIQFLLKLHRIWDLLAEDICQNPREIMARLCRESSRSVLFESIYQERRHVILTFFGQIDSGKNFDEYLERLLPILHGKDCLLNLSYCTYIDNSGFSFLLKLRKEVLNMKRKIKICGLTEPIEQAFKMTELTNLFPLYPDQDTALEA